MKRCLARWPLFRSRITHEEERATQVQVEDHQRGFCDDDKVSMLRLRLDLCRDRRLDLCRDRRLDLCRHRRLDLRLDLHRDLRVD